MRVLALTTTFLRWKDDMRPPFVYELSRRLQGPGSDVIVLAPHHAGAKKFELMDGMKVYRFSYFKPERLQRLAYGGGVLPNLKESWLARVQLPILFLSELFSALILIKREKINVINAHWIYPQGLVGIICKKLTGVPVVVIVHGTDVNAAKKSRLLRSLCSYVFKNSDRISVNSSFIMDAVLAIDRGAVKKIELIPMGVDVNLFKPHPGNAARGAPTVLTVGRLIELKGIAYLIRAMKDVVKRYPDAMLVIGGSGPEKENLEDLTNELGLNKNVRFIGFIQNAELPGHYAAADVFVLPSINKDGLTEALGVVLLEAMASGTPVIGSDVGGIPDIIRDGHNGFLVPERSPGPLAERIIELLSNEKLAEKFRVNGLNTIKDGFSWESISRRFDEINRGLGGLEKA